MSSPAGRVVSLPPSANPKWCTRSMPATPVKQSPNAALREGRLDLAMMRKIIRGKVDEDTVRRAHRRALAASLPAVLDGPMVSAAYTDAELDAAKRAESADEADGLSQQVDRFHRLQEEIKNLRRIPEWRPSTNMFPSANMEAMHTVLAHYTCKQQQLQQDVNRSSNHLEAAKVLEGEDLAHSVVLRHRERKTANKSDVPVSKYAEDVNSMLETQAYNYHSALLDMLAEKEKYLEALMKADVGDAIALMENKDAVKRLIMDQPNYHVREEIEDQLKMWAKMAEDPVAQDQIQAMLQEYEANLVESQAMAEKGEVSLSTTQGEMRYSMKQLREAAEQFEAMVSTARKQTRFIPVFEYRTIATQTDTEDRPLTKNNLRLHLRTGSFRAAAGSSRGGLATRPGSRRRKDVDIAIQISDEHSEVSVLEIPETPRTPTAGEPNPSSQQIQESLLLSKEKHLTKQLCREELMVTKLRDTINTLKVDLVDKETQLEKLKYEMREVFTGTGFAELLDLTQDAPPQIKTHGPDLMAMLRQLKDEYLRAQASHRDTVNKLQTENWQLKAAAAAKASMMEAKNQRLEAQVSEAEHLVDEMGANIKDYNVRYGILEMRHIDAEREYRRRILDLQTRMDELNANDRLQGPERERMREHLMAEYDKVDSLRKELDFQRYQKELLYRSTHLLQNTSASGVDPMLTHMEKCAVHLRHLSHQACGALEELSSAPVQTLRMQAATTISSMLNSIQRQTQQELEQLKMMEQVNATAQGKKVNQILKEVQGNCQDATALVTTVPTSEAPTQPAERLVLVDSDPNAMVSKQAADFTQKCIADFLQSIGKAVNSADGGNDKDVSYNIDMNGLSPEALQLCQPVLGQLVHSFVNVQHYVVKMRMQARVLAQQNRGGRPTQFGFSSENNLRSPKSEQLRLSMNNGQISDIDDRLLGGLYTLKSWARHVRKSLQVQIVKALQSAKLPLNDQKILEHWLWQEQQLRKQSVVLIFQRTATRAVFAKQISNLTELAMGAIDEHERGYLNVMQNMTRLKYARKLEESVAQSFALEQSWAEVFEALVRLYKNKFGEKAWDILLHGDSDRPSKLVTKSVQTDQWHEPPKPKRPPIKVVTNPAHETAPESQPSARSLAGGQWQSLEWNHRGSLDEDFNMGLLEPNVFGPLLQQALMYCGPPDELDHQMSVAFMDDADISPSGQDVLADTAAIDFDTPAYQAAASPSHAALKSSLKKSGNGNFGRTATELVDSSHETPKRHHPRRKVHHSPKHGDRNRRGAPSLHRVAKARQALGAHLNGKLTKSAPPQAAALLEEALTEPSAILRIVGHEPLTSELRAEMDQALSLSTGMALSSIQEMPLTQCLRLAVASQVQQSGSTLEELMELPFLELFARMTKGQVKSGSPGKSEGSSRGRNTTSERQKATPEPNSSDRQDDSPRTLPTPVSAVSVSRRASRTPTTSARLPLDSSAKPKLHQPKYEPPSMSQDDDDDVPVDPVEMKKKFRPGQCMSHILGNIRGLSNRQLKAIAERGKEAEQRLLAGGPIAPEDMDDKLMLVQALRLRISMLEDELLRLGGARSRFMAQFFRKTVPTAVVSFGMGMGLSSTPASQPMMHHPSAVAHATFATPQIHNAGVLVQNTGLHNAIYSVPPNATYAMPMLHTKPGMVSTSNAHSPPTVPSSPRVMDMSNSWGDASKNSSSWPSLRSMARRHDLQVVVGQNSAVHDAPQNEQPHIPYYDENLVERVQQMINGATFPDSLASDEPDSAALEETIQMREAMERVFAAMTTERRNVATMTDGPSWIHGQLIVWQSKVQPHKHHEISTRTASPVGGTRDDGDRQRVLHKVLHQVLFEVMQVDPDYCLLPRNRTAILLELENSSPKSGLCVPSGGETGARGGPRNQGEVGMDISIGPPTADSTISPLYSVLLDHIARQARALAGLQPLVPKPSGTRVNGNPRVAVHELTLSTFSQKPPTKKLSIRNPVLSRP